MCFWALSYSTKQLWSSLLFSSFLPLSSLFSNFWALISHHDSLYWTTNALCTSSIHNEAHAPYEVVQFFRSYVIEFLILETLVMNEVSFGEVWIICSVEGFWGGGVGDGFLSRFHSHLDCRNIKRCQLTRPWSFNTSQHAISMIMQDWRSEDGIPFFDFLPWHFSTLLSTVSSCHSLHDTYDCLMMLWDSVNDKKSRL